MNTMGDSIEFLVVFFICHSLSLFDNMVMLITGIVDLCARCSLVENKRI